MFTGNIYQVGLLVTQWRLDFRGACAAMPNAALAQYLSTGKGPSRRPYLAGVRKSCSRPMPGAERAAAEQYDLARNTLEARRASFELAKRAFMWSATSSALACGTTSRSVAQARVAAAQLARQCAQAQNALEVLVGKLIGEIATLPAPMRKLSDEQHHQRHPGSAQAVRICRRSVFGQHPPGRTGPAAWPTRTTQERGAGRRSSRASP